jgi:hypothetical protein
MESACKSKSLYRAERVPVVQYEYILRELAMLADYAQFAIRLELELKLGVLLGCVLHATAVIQCRTVVGL